MLSVLEGVDASCGGSREVDFVVDAVAWVLNAAQYDVKETSVDTGHHSRDVASANAVEFAIKTERL